MNALRKITTSLSNFSETLAPDHLTTGYCKQCDRDTRWLVNFARGRFRCTECADADNHRHQ